MRLIAKQSKFNKALAQICTGKTSLLFVKPISPIVFNGFLKEPYSE